MIYVFPMVHILHSKTFWIREGSKKLELVDFFCFRYICLIQYSCTNIVFVVFYIINNTYTMLLNT